jgi:hypothetical protein
MAMKKKAMKSMLARDGTCGSSSLCDRRHRFDEHRPRSKRHSAA